MLNLERARGGAPLPELAVRDVARDRARRRHAAIQCLQAAARTKDVLERNSLRRQAAELVLPRRKAAAGRYGVVS